MDALIASLENLELQNILYLVKIYQQKKRFYKI